MYTYTVPAYRPCALGWRNRAYIPIENPIQVHFVNLFLFGIQFGYLLCPYGDTEWMI